MNLPVLRDDLRGFEKAAGLSVDVLVKAEKWGNIMIGRYIHGLGEWQLNNVSGDPPVITEWWYVPEIGTGNKPL